MTRFIISTGESVLWARATSTMHPISYTGPVAGHVDTTVTHGAFDTSTPTLGKVLLSLDDLTSNDARYDREMRERLDAHRYPTVTARLKQAKPRGPDRFRLSGDLTLHGQTRRLQGDAVVTLSDSRLFATGRVVIDIRDFGLEPPKLLIFKVEPEIEVAIEIVADLDEAAIPSG